jgi:hypothetical protein
MSHFFGQSADIADVMVAIAAGAISLIALGVALWTALLQRQHNRLSVRPLAQILVRDLRGHIRVKLYNNGTGALISAMPDGGEWGFFVGNVDGRSIRPGASINLLDLKYDESSKPELEFSRQVRTALQHLTVSVKYGDIYGKKMPVYEKALDWFGRTL